MVGENIKYLRKRNGLSQKELADKLGLSNKTISSWERNRTEPNMECCDKLCRVLGCSRNQLVSGFDDIPIIPPNIAEVIDLFSRCDSEQKQAVLNLLHCLVQESNKT